MVAGEPSQAYSEVLDRLAAVHVIEEGIRMGRLSPTPRLLFELQRLVAAAGRWAQVLDALSPAA